MERGEPVHSPNVDYSLAQALSAWRSRGKSEVVKAMSRVCVTGQVGQNPIIMWMDRVSGDSVSGSMRKKAPTSENWEENATSSSPLYQTERPPGVSHIYVGA